MTRRFSAVFSFMNLSFIQGSNVLVQLLLIPIITRTVGLTEFGFIMLASSYAALVSIFINYGSNQSAVKEVAVEKNSTIALTHIFYNVYIIRILLYLIAFLVFVGLRRWVLPENTGHHFLFANMLILGELFNPFFFFVGLQKLFLYNVVTLLSKVLSVILIIAMVQHPSDSVWVNFFIGSTQVLGYLILILYLIKQYKLFPITVSLQKLGQQLKLNFYLTGNNLSVQLQQSIFLFAVSGMHNPVLLGAYSLCDKFVWSFRMLIISFFNVVYPRAAVLQKDQPQAWMVLKSKLTKGLWIVLSVAAMVLLFFAHPIVNIVTGEPNDLAAFFIQSICFMPLIAGLNSLNVTELLLRNQYKAIFTIAIILLVISAIAAFIFSQWGQARLFGFFPILIELCSIPLYLYFIKRTSE